MATEVSVHGVTKTNQDKRVTVDVESQVRGQTPREFDKIIWTDAQGDELGRRQRD